MEWNLERTWRISHESDEMNCSDRQQDGEILTVLLWLCFSVCACLMYRFYLKQMMSHPLIFPWKHWRKPPPPQSCRWWWFTGLRLISQTHFTCHYPGAGTNSWFYGLETAGMPNAVLKLPWLMSLQAVKSYFLKIFRWSFSIQSKMVPLPRLLRVTTAEKWLKNSQDVCGINDSCL